MNFKLTEIEREMFVLIPGLKWNESEHPRDDRGRFRNKPSNESNNENAVEQKPTKAKENEARKLFYSKLRNNYFGPFRLGPNFTHESPGFIGQSFLKRGIGTGSESIFATIRKPSNFVSGDKTRVTFRLPLKHIENEDIVPDMRYDPNAPYSDILKEHPTLTGADVSINMQIQPLWIDKIEHINKDGKVTVIFNRQNRKRL